MNYYRRITVACVNLIMYFVFGAFCIRPLRFGLQSPERRLYSERSAYRRGTVDYATSFFRLSCVVGGIKN
jgi:hypothetical protein